jgi:hypothetical protein
MIFPLPTSGSLVWTGCAKADQACLLELRLGRGRRFRKRWEVSSRGGFPGGK